MTTTWESKANRIIASMCMQSYREANTLPNGQMRKRHIPYSVPMDAELLIRCLKTGDEETAKAIFHRHAFGAINR